MTTPEKLSVALYCEVAKEDDQELYYGKEHEEKVGALVDRFKSLKPQEIAQEHTDVAKADVPKEVEELIRQLKNRMGVHRITYEQKSLIITSTTAVSGGSSYGRPQKRSSSTLRNDQWNKVIHLIKSVTFYGFYIEPEDKAWFQLVGIPVVDM